MLRNVKPNLQSIHTSTHTRTHARACESSHCRPAAGLHVDGVGVLLAQRFVLLGVERLTLEVYVANLHGGKTESGFSWAPESRQSQKHSRDTSRGGDRPCEEQTIPARRRLSLQGGDCPYKEKTVPARRRLSLQRGDGCLF